MLPHILLFIIVFELNLHSYPANAGRAGRQDALQVKIDDIA